MNKILGWYFAGPINRANNDEGFKALGFSDLRKVLELYGFIVCIHPQHITMRLLP